MGSNWGILGGGDLAMCLSGDTGLKWGLACWSFLELGLDARVLELDLQLAVLELGLDLDGSIGVPALGL